jgi:hypothetical protein
MSASVNRASEAPEQAPETKPASHVRQLGGEVGALSVVAIEFILGFSRFTLRATLRARGTPAPAKSSFSLVAPSVLKRMWLLLKDQQGKHSGRHMKDRLCDPSMTASSPAVRYT